MKKTYDPKSIEQRWYSYWEARGDFAPSGEGVPYCIMIPPPNVTGSLHMGHAFQDTLMDALVRYQRMDGRNTLWQVGADHAGIATQMVVERQLNMEGQTRTELGRERFIKRVWEWRERSGGTITRQLRRMGASVDWSRERFTMDEGLSQAVIEVFVRLYDEGLIYRGKRLVNWDPVLHTALSNLEVISAEETGQLWHFRYPLADENAHVVIATTRPETMLGDTAVAVHPDDERYRALIGKQIKLPLTGRIVPIVADDYVDPEFGTGCVKITPGHDFNDYDIGRRHDLPIVNVLTPDARLNDNAPAPYRDLDRFEARKRIVADMHAAGLVEKTEPHKLMIPRGDRSGEVIEPFLTDQWYMHMQPLAKPAIAAVEDGRIRFIPDNWKNTYFEWQRNIEDWCISRQLWWGHRIPAWYDESGNVYVGRDEAEVRAKHGISDEIALKQDEDVLDTWFSSALWPFSTLGWPADTPELDTFYPTNVLVTGFDIIFFWVARMIMMGLKFTGEIPFHEVYIHALIRDADGQKMSKSKGNVLDPIDLIDGIGLEALVEKRASGLMQPQMAKQIEHRTRREFPQGIPAYGTDALRFTFTALASPGRDIRFDLGRIDGYRNFCNKLWNAARYVLMNVDAPVVSAGGDRELGLPERWIYSRLAHTTAELRGHFQTYRFDLAAKAAYEFVWNAYCDWYLELTKPVLRDAAPARQAGARHTLVNVLEILLRLLHPMIPFITEDIWQRTAPVLGIEGETIMRRPFPDHADAERDENAEAEMRWLMDFVLGIRRIRGEMNIAPSKPLPVLLAGASTKDRARLERHRAYLDALARLESITVLNDSETAPQAATALLGEMKILVPMAGLIDVEAEIERLSRQMAELESNLAQSQKKLANANFVTRAPEAVVNKERSRLEETEQALTQLAEQMDKIKKLL